MKKEQILWLTRSKVMALTNEQEIAADNSVLEWSFGIGFKLSKERLSSKFKL